MTKNEQALAALKEVTDIIYDVAKSEPMGAPSGVVYATLMGHMGLTTYNSIIALMVKQGRIKVSNHVITAI